MSLKILPDLERYCFKEGITSAAELNQFLSICCYYGDFLPGYLALSPKLYQVIIQKVDDYTPFLLTLEERNSFKKLQQELIDVRQNL